MLSVVRHSKSPPEVLSDQTMKLGMFDLLSVITLCHAPLCLRRSLGPSQRTDGAKRSRRRFTAAAARAVDIDTSVAPLRFFRLE